jgi:DnaJ homolog subfamily C member 28
VLVGRLESLVEKKIREAMEEGEFDNLPGKGKPIDLTENPFEDPDLRVVHKLLRDAGFAPAWIEERKDIDTTFELARQTLSRAYALYRLKGRSPSNADWVRSVSEFRAKVAELNGRIRLYNLKAPAAVFHRRQIDAEKIIWEIERDRRHNEF